MLKLVGNWLRDYLFLKRQSIKMGLAIRMADLKQRAYNRQYHIVLLAIGKEARLTSLCREDFLTFKRRKALGKDVTFFDLIHQKAFYSTPVSRNNRSSREDRESAIKRYLKFVKLLGE